MPSVSIPFANRSAIAPLPYFDLMQYTGEGQSDLCETGVEGWVEEGAESYAGLPFGPRVASAQEELDDRDAETSPQTPILLSRTMSDTKQEAEGDLAAPTVVENTPTVSGTSSYSSAFSPGRSDASRTQETEPSPPPRSLSLRIVSLL